MSTDIKTTKETAVAVDAGAASDSTSTEASFSQVTRTWKGYIWDTWDLPKEQRWLLFKVDACVLTFASIGYFLKNIDQTNIQNAFLSGMKEDMNMYSNELVTSTSIWTVGYVIGQIPCNLLLTVVSPRWVIPTLELGWGIATFATSSVKDIHALYALRFLVGFFESGFYPGIHYMLGCWYTPREIGKRAMIFWLAGSVGTLFSGFLQSAAYTNLHNVGGRAGWRWLFIVDGIITLPLALLGYIFFPNDPQHGKRTWWTTEKEHHIAAARMRSVGRATKGPWTKAKVRRIALSWHTYLLPLCYVLWNNAYPQPAMGYWLKSFNKTPAPVPGVHFTVPQINNLPLATTGIFIGMAIFWGWLSDGPLKGARWPFLYIGAAITIVFNILLLKMPLYTNIEGRKIVYWLSAIGNGAGPLLLSWINEICSADTEKRAFLIAAANDFAYVVQAVAPNFVWKTTDFPAARKGYTWSTILQSLLILETALIQLLLWRDNRNAKKHGDLETNPDVASETSPEISEQPPRIENEKSATKTGIDVI
ncbi:allantoate permease [Ophiostoma piceae UAMH 11346]|uniref:Allantoate permease n=1 Tax=Ophiostoma piceae (strain UAMH 11346) TaxID=1262450 RepID=S3BP71_OPHP1|nr:allantoate permease [Ophiostoma piceae UAMH 11346]